MLNIKNLRKDCVRSNFLEENFMFKFYQKNIIVIEKAQFREITIRLHRVYFYIYYGYLRQRVYTTLRIPVLHSRRYLLIN